MAFSSQRENGKIDVMQHPMTHYAKKGDDVLIGRDKGEEARHDIERSAREEPPGTPIALDFKTIRSVSVPFADALLVPLLSNRQTGYYEERPILVVNASEDVGETLAATLSRRGLFVLGLPQLRLLGGERSLEDTLDAASEFETFSASQIAEVLGVSLQAANNRLKMLLDGGALIRRRVIPVQGGREFAYEIPHQNGGPRKKAPRSKPKPGRKASTKPRALR